MADSSSPLLPIRQLIAKSTARDDDGNDCDYDTIPCSPAALMQRTPPTKRTSGLLPLSSSSPPPSPPPLSSVVEVPASSPFQKSKLGSRLAPAGTFFRPPPVSVPVPSLKRPCSNTISLLSDSDDSDDYNKTKTKTKNRNNNSSSNTSSNGHCLSLRRGDIQPTDFKSHISAFAYKPRAVVDDQGFREKMRQVYHVLGDRFTPEVVREALRARGCDVDDAIQFLEKKQGFREKMKQVYHVLGDRFTPEVVREALRARGCDVDDTIQFLEEQGRKKKRRLVKGRRPSLVSPKRSSPRKPSSSPMPSSPGEEAEEAEVILIKDDDDDDDDADEYQDLEAEEVVGGEDDNRVLDTINKATVKDLAAMTGLKETLLEPFVERRPFAGLHAARKVNVVKPGARRGGRACIGETVVDAVQVFMDAVAATDEVVATCEAKARAVRDVVDSWDLDCFGHSKRKQTPDDDDNDNDDGAPPTPNSLSSFVPPLVPQQPELMDGHCRMKPFQLFGLNWMTLLYKHEIGCILADDMGLGKTCQVISFLCQLVETAATATATQDARPWPNLVVVPPSTYNNWLSEFEKFAPGLSVIGYRGSQSERAAIAYEVEQDLDAYQVVLATYSQINSEADLEAMRSFRLNAAIFDEGHKMKNPETKLYKDLGRIPAAWKMLLTGTPVQNNLLEMTSLLSFINPRLFQGYMHHIQYIFSQKITMRNVSNGAFLYSERVKRARTILEPFILQRRKDQVLRDLPRKTCRVVYCDMTEEQAVVYAEYEKLFKMSSSSAAAAAVARRRPGGRQNDQNNVWIQLRKAALHPLLFRRHFSDEAVSKMARMLMERVPQSELHQPDVKHLARELSSASDFELHLWCRDYPFLQGFDIAGSKAVAGQSGKVRTLLGLIAEYEGRGDRVLVFSKFARVVEMLQEVLARQGTRYGVLMGQTRVGERQAVIDEFNNGGMRVLLLTTGAGATGINLTAANKIVIFDQSDNPQDDIQAENRAHRLGQTREVEVLRLVSRGTVEELIYEACQKKIELARKVTGVMAEEEEGDERELEAEVRRRMMES